MKAFRILDEQEVEGEYRISMECEVVPTLCGNLSVIDACLGMPSIYLSGIAAPPLLKAEVIWPTADIDQRMRLASLRKNTKSQDARSMDEAMTAARAVGASVLIWCDDNGGAQAFSSTTLHALAPRIESKWSTGSDRRKAFTQDDIGRLFSAITGYWDDEVFNGTHLYVQVNNVATAKQSRLLRNTMRGLAGCKSVEQMAADNAERSLTLAVRDGLGAGLS